MLTMTVEYFEAHERMQDLIDAVLQGREVVVMYFGEPVAKMGFHGPPGEPPRELVETAVRNGFAALAREIGGPEELPSWMWN